jgi:hypothetical protein
MEKDYRKQNHSLAQVEILVSHLAHRQTDSHQCHSKEPEHSDKNKGLLRLFADWGRHDDCSVLRSERSGLPECQMLRCAVAVDILGPYNGHIQPNCHRRACDPSLLEIGDPCATNFWSL